MGGFIGILIVQVTILILFGIFVRYDFEMLPIDVKSDNFTADELAAIEQQHRASYPRKYSLLPAENNSHARLNFMLMITIANEDKTQMPSLNGQKFPFQPEMTFKQREMESIRFGSAFKMRQTNAEIIMLQNYEMKQFMNLP